MSYLIFDMLIYEQETNFLFVSFSLWFFAQCEKCDTDFPWIDTRLPNYYVPNEYTVWLMISPEVNFYNGSVKIGKFLYFCFTHYIK